MPWQNRWPWPGMLALPALFMAAQLHNPLFMAIRSWAAPALFLTGLVLLVLAAKPRKGPGRWLGTAAWAVVITLILAGEYNRHQYKRNVLAAADRNPRLMARLGEHLVIGYGQAADVRELACRGLIGGLFVTRHNALGRTASQLRRELAGLQALRRQAGLPPLMIATDQEGGKVSRLSPPLPLPSALASVTDNGRSWAETDRLAAAIGREQGSALASLGVNANFSPVVDLKPERASLFLDFHTQIADRAISRRPEVVARVALAYSRALSSQGVLPTLKHFPGLGSVSSDTHIFSAHLTEPLNTLKTRDWLPFRQILSHTPAMLMVGHAILDALDRERPASLSPRVLTDLLRGEWGFQGVLISDDMTMGAIYERGLCEASTQALDAGMDLLLLSYDWGQYYKAMDCLQRAAGEGKLASLMASHARLEKLPWRRAGMAAQPSSELVRTLLLENGHPTWRTPPMHAEQDMQRLKARIAEVYARREELKKALENGGISPTAGFRHLEESDRELSDLDTRFKALWDGANAKPGAMPHPAAAWAAGTEFEPLHLDCIIAVMLKILDGKCKMGEEEKSALATAYDVAKTRPGHSFGPEIHPLIAAARQGGDAATVEAIHAWRIEAESRIAKEDMKSFKAMLAENMPLA